ncbi:hypothetical protein C3492_10495 [Streptomyces sp. Ru62]|nr:hypothetical protein C3492_10495 [Streptomyces sp. Ru62]
MQHRAPAGCQCPQGAGHGPFLDTTARAPRRTFDVARDARVSQREAFERLCPLEVSVLHRLGGNLASPWAVLRSVGGPTCHGGLVSLKNAYLETAAQAVALLDAPEVAASWEKPSALAQWTVSGLAGHLAYQMFSVDPALEGPASEQQPVPVLEHYARAVWIDAPLDGEISSGIRAKGEGISSEGVRRLVERVRATLDRQRTGLEEVHGDWVVFIPQTGWALSLDDFLVTRLVELAVHMDDLAISVGLSTPELPGTALDPVVALLTGLAVRRHGQAALLRALTRAERAPAAINVF